MAAELNRSQLRELRGGHDIAGERERHLGDVLRRDMDSGWDEGAYQNAIQEVVAGEPRQKTTVTVYKSQR